MQDLQLKIIEIVEPVRSPFDIIAIGKTLILLCQVKSGRGKFRDVRKQLGLLKVPRCARKLLKIHQKGRWKTVTIR